MSQRLSHITLLLCAMLCSVTALADNYIGKVLDGNGDPLTGAIVRIVDSDKTIVTDIDGRFRLHVPGDKAVKVQVSYIGFITDTPILRPASADSKEQVIHLTPDLTCLDE
ncbi:MAG: carboxypeptidase-like regulatory domain-containing protein, partial [Muribaculaceae bacterium]|nr:carboxypeptidase-like regulatory domain-containing protein [Muribaculaceae bacterium]